MTTKPVKTRLVNELLYLSVLLFIGVLLLPGAIFLVGGQVFGDFEGGFGAFFGGLMRQLADGNLSSWFLVLSPYLSIQAMRLSVKTYRSAKFSR